MLSFSGFRIVRGCRAKPWTSASGGTKKMPVPLVGKLILFSIAKKVTIFLVAKTYGFPRLYRRTAEVNRFINRHNPRRRENVRSFIQGVFRLPRRACEKFSQIRSTRIPFGVPKSLSFSTKARLPTSGPFVQLSALAEQRPDLRCRSTLISQNVTSRVFAAAGRREAVPSSRDQATVQHLRGCSLFSSTGASVARWPTSALSDGTRDVPHVSGGTGGTCRSTAVPYFAAGNRGNLPTKVQTHAPIPVSSTHARHLLSYALFGRAPAVLVPRLHALQNKLFPEKQTSDDEVTATYQRRAEQRRNKNMLAGTAAGTAYQWTRGARRLGLQQLLELSRSHCGALSTASGTMT
ncbi:hypothetical protein CBR_g4471 [Chara braunii]|uniref:Uncharacterized protein n=1 Tax=Chara braunii TaxID=69332 RepID=A0A388KHW9_CHABU|nr:hypothetical protein CBR_g4471 [Chara braunii]|eukprot:GBG69642.1 hypothetical protein CBR_g4471 [Chara braunii]